MPSSESSLCYVATLSCITSHVLILITRTKDGESGIYGLQANALCGGAGTEVAVVSIDLVMDENTFITENVA